MDVASAIAMPLGFADSGLPCIGRLKWVISFIEPTLYMVSAFFLVVLFMYFSPFCRTSGLLIFFGVRRVLE